MGILLLAQGKLGEAEPYLRNALEKRHRVLGEEHPDTLISVNNLGTLLIAQGKHAAAEQLLVPAEIATRKVFAGDNARRLASFLLTLGEARKGLGEFAAAETNLLEAQPIFVKSRGPQHKDTRECTQAIVDLYAAWNHAQPGKSYNAKAADWKRKLDALAAPASAKGAHG